MKKITVIGSCNTDMVVKSNKLPLPGETIVGGSFFMNAGGKGANQAVATARLGVPTVFITKTGNDMFGRQSLSLFEKEGINVDYIVSDMNNPSGVALIMVDERGENSIVVAPGANAQLSEEDILRAKAEIATSEVLLMQLEIPMKTVEEAANIAYSNGVKVVLNPAPAQIISTELLKKLYLITPNRGEAELLTGIKIVDWNSAKEAAKVIADKGVDHVIITLGPKGSLIYSEGVYTVIDIYKVKTIDTTGAGDTFNGALCVGLLDGLCLIDAAKFASKAAAIAVTKLGAQTSIPTKEEVMTFRN